MRASEARYHVQVYVIAEKYTLIELCNLARIQIIISLKPTGELPEIHEVIRDIYDNTWPSDTLRKFVALLVSKHGTGEFAIPREKFGDLIVELPEFGRDLVQCLCEAMTTREAKTTSKSVISVKRRRVASGAQPFSSGSSSRSSSDSSAEYF